MKRRGIELVEVLVVIAILGVLAGLLIPAVMAARDYTSKTQDVKQTTTSRVVVERLYSSMSIEIFQVTVDGETYYLAKGSTPIIQLRSDKVLKLEKE